MWGCVAAWLHRFTGDGDRKTAGGHSDDVCLLGNCAVCCGSALKYDLKSPYDHKAALFCSQEYALVMQSPLTTFYTPTLVVWLWNIGRGADLLEHSYCVRVHAVWDVYAGECKALSRSVFSWVSACVSVPCVFPLLSLSEYLLVIPFKGPPSRRWLEVVYGPCPQTTPSQGRQSASLRATRRGVYSEQSTHLTVHRQNSQQTEQSTDRTVHTQNSQQTEQSTDRTVHRQNSPQTPTAAGILLKPSIMLLLLLYIQLFSGCV